MIPCIEQCVYQRNGSCNLRRASRSGGVKNECAYFVESKKRGGK